MNAPTPIRSRGLPAAGAAVVLLAAVSTLSVAAASDGFDRHSNIRAATACAVPALPGDVVSVNLIDMRAMMGSGGGPMMGQNDWRRFRPGDDARHRHSSGRGPRSRIAAGNQHRLSEA
jgi:hypothetical protein